MIDGPTGRDGPHVFVADLDHPVLDDADRHHLARVLRLRTGDRFTVSDGDGRWRPARFGSAIEPDGDVATVSAPAPHVTVAFSLVKGDRPEWVTQRLTEMGVDHIRPFSASRSVVRWDERRARAANERMQRIAREAAMQSRRCRLPQVWPLGTWAEVARLDGAVMAERDAPPLGLAHPTVLIGPEGGWSQEELSVGLTKVGLGDHVLRSETAALAAGAILTYLRAAAQRTP